MAHIGNAPFGKTVRTVTSETLTSVKTAYYPTGGYIVGYVDVYVNGVRLTETADFTATDGTTVTLLYSPSIGDTVDVVTYGSIELANAVRRDGDTLVGTLYTRALVPTANVTYDIGTSTMRYKDIYLSGNTINLGDIKLSTNGTAFSVSNTTGGTFPSSLANTTITGTANVSTSLNVGANINLSTSNVSIGNTTINVSITSQSISVASDTVGSGLNTNTNTKLKAIGTTASYIVTAISNNSVEAFMGADGTNRAIFGAYTNHGVELRANNDAKVIAYSNGVVTLPYQPMVSVEMSGQQTLTHQIETRINFDTITSSTAAGSGSYSTTNRRFTAPITGSYLVCFHIYVYSTDQVEGLIYKNGTSFIRRAGRTANINANPNGVEMSHVLRLVAGDYIEIWGYQGRYGDTAAATVYTAGNRPSHLSIMLLG